jgi:rhodanese-related sulfurtransferase
LFIVKGEIKKELTIMSYRMISPKELYKKMKMGEKTYLLDVRAKEKFKDFHIEGPGIITHNVPKTNILEGGEEMVTVLTEGEVIITCTTGNSAAKCAAILSEKDDNILVLEGGVTAWKEFLKTL